MPKAVSTAPGIRLRGVRHNNLKGFDLDLPVHRLIVVTGLSGSGKSSLAFDTLFAEGQRRYIETFSPYARQFFDRMDKPRVASIEGIPPAVAIEQRNAVRSTRSTVGTMTEVCDYLKVIWPHLARLHCRQCGQPVCQDTPQSIWRDVQEGVSASENRTLAPGESEPIRGEVLITFALPLSSRLSVADSLGLIARQGYQRLLIDGEVCRVEEAAGRLSTVPPHLTVVQDRVRSSAANRARFIEACEQAYHFGHGRLSVQSIGGSVRRFSSRLHCAACDLEYPTPTPALFSFNHPSGACPTCKGFGRVITIDYGLALPDPSRTLAGGAVKPWQTGVSAECQADLLKFCQRRKVPVNVPFSALSPEHQRWVIEGEPDYGSDADHQWPRAWYGIKGYFRWLESKAYKMHVRVLLSRYRAYSVCPDCAGRRFQPDSLLYRLSLGSVPGSKAAADSLTLADFYALPICDALASVERVAARQSGGTNDPFGVALAEVRMRLGYLVEVGLGYLTLDRPTRTLSGGETERVNLTTCLGSRLVNTLFVLDEPSVGLHPRDTARLIRILERLRDAGNTVVVVEHEASVMRAADQIVDLGPGHGETGGEVVFQGTYRKILSARNSLTGEYLSGRKSIPLPRRRPVGALAGQGLSSEAVLRLSGINRHNLRQLEVAIPLGRFVCVTGVSGSGKSTLIRDVLHPALVLRLQASEAVPAAGADRELPEESDGDPTGATDRTLRLTGHESLARVIHVDQSSLGRTPRSNAAVYVGAFDDLRDLFAASEPARARELTASAFSFNSAQGQCERCRGAGFEKIEMQFLSDVFIRCPDCDGRRYRPHLLEIKIGGNDARARSDGQATGGWSIADLLEASVDAALNWLGGFLGSRPARRAAAKLGLLQEVGLGYLALGQPINTLSGGESQRLKLAAHLAEATAAAPASVGQSQRTGSTLFLFDEPTTGLHFDDIRVLLQVFQRLVEAGHSVIVIEHNLEVIRSADWVIDLGPDAGEAGGQVVAQGTPEDIAACETSHTGRAMRESKTLAG
ncbi:MAG: excinuclease ABC subunit UvrA [Limisphaerales bacterium]